MSQVNEGKRTKNFTPQEKELLINLAIKYKSRIEDKKTDSVSIAEKNTAWEKLTQEYNASSSFKRDAKQLKAFYKNSKSNLKKDVAADKIEIYKTGGGRARRKVDENNPLLAIVGVETTPLENNYDSSCDYFLPNETTSDERNNVDNDLPGEKDVHPDCDENAATLTNNNQKSTENLSCKHTDRAPTRKRRSNKELQIYVEKIAQLKQNKLEAQIEKTKAKTKVYEKKLEILEVLEREVKGD